MIDIGVNLTNSRFDGDRDAVIARALACGVTTMVLTGTSVAVSEQAVHLARTYGRQYPGALYCTAGIHPHEATSCGADAIQRLEDLIAEHRQLVVAVGETGLDFNRDFSPRDVQAPALEAQIELAIRVGLPLFLHERDAGTAQRDILRGFGSDLPPAVIHCFTGDRHSLEAYLAMDLWIGITGWICDERRGTGLQELAPLIPADRLLVETDAPYLTPRNLKPRPGNNRNEPAYLGTVVAMLAHCRCQTPSQVAADTTANARQFFRLAAD